MSKRQALLVVTLFVVYLLFLAVLWVEMDKGANRLGDQIQSPTFTTLSSR